MCRARPSAACVQQQHTLHPDTDDHGTLAGTISPWGGQHSHPLRAPPHASATAHLLLPAVPGSPMLMSVSSELAARLWNVVWVEDSARALKKAWEISMSGLC